MDIKRNELKYFISEHEYQILSRKLKEILPSDSYSKPGKGYFIRSLYFDSAGDRAFWEKQAGVGERRKYRLRVYDLGAKKVKFEVKHKLSGQAILKETAEITREEAEEVQKGNYEGLLKYKDKILNKIYYEFKREKYYPVAVIDYVREAYILPFNHIRITFDRFLKSNDDDCSNIFKKDLFMKPIFKPGITVLEIKYDGFIPEWIKKILQIKSFERSAISKYFNGRLAYTKIYLGV